MAQDDEVILKTDGWFWRWFSWSGSSSTMLRTVERKILSYLKTPYKGSYVDIGPVVGASDKIWTISLNHESPQTPILLLHGLGAGVALWILNLDSLAKHRPVYAIDVLGFGRSSRPAFSRQAHEAENQLVKSVEEWRKEMQLEKFVLLGHSMGGFLAASYAIQYPQHVKHLILADPWGFPEKPNEVVYKPLWLKVLAFMITPLNPLWAVRLAGPLGQWLIETTRPDIVKKFSPVLKDDPNIISQYIHQCNVQTPSGEGAFHAMMEGFRWAKNPIVKRIDQLHPEIPITLLCGNRSWLDAAGDTIKEVRSTSYVNVQIITGAGHHVYLDRSETFNKYVLEASSLSDKYKKLTSSVNARQEFKLTIDNQVEKEDEADEKGDITDNINDAEKPKSN